MAREQESADWGCAIPALLLVAAGAWWWKSGETTPPPPPVIVPSASLPSAASLPIQAQVEPAAPAAPAHNYAFKEADAYGYIAAVSEEESKRGKVAGDVVMFRYGGFWDDEFHLERLDDNGDVIGLITCSKPCIAIKRYSSGSMTRTAYDPASIVGAAMEDAMNGRLKRTAPKSEKPKPVADAVVADREPTTEEIMAQPHLADTVNMQ
jgi:hypothetical protein